MNDLNTSTLVLNGAGKPASGKHKRTKIPYAGKEAKKIPVPGPKAPGASAADSFPSSYKYKGLQIVSRGFGDIAVYGAIAKAPWADCFVVAGGGQEGRFDTTQAAATWIDANMGKIDDPMCVGMPVALQVHNRKPLTPEQEAALKTAKAIEQIDRNTDIAAFENQQADINIRKRQVAKANKTATGITEPLTGKVALDAIKGKTPKGAGSSKPSTGKAQKPKKGKGATRVAAEPQKRASKGATGKTGTKVGQPRPAAGAEGEPRKGSKAEMVGNMLRQPSGCTAADVMKACGWPSVSMPAQAKAAGLKLRKEKTKGEPARYYGS